MAPPDETAEATETAEWSRLWPLCLQASAGRQPPPLGHTPSGAPWGLGWSAATGWTLAGPWSADTAALYALYKPLLDVRAPAAAAAGAPPPCAPWVLGQLAQSLDGFVAMPSGESCYISGPHSLQHLHRLRALCDAVIVGAGTVAADNPRLTTRRVPGRNPVRVVIDPDLGLDPACGLFNDGQAPTLCLHDARLHPDAARRAAAADCEWVAVDGLRRADGGLTMAAVVAALRGRGLARLFFEGGGSTVSLCIAQGVLDRLHLTLAPLLIGRGRRGLQMPEQARLADCLRPQGRAVVLGQDMLWDLDLRVATAAGR